MEEHLAKLSKLVSAGPWQHAVPDPLRIASVRRMTGLDEIAEFLRSARIEHIEEPSAELTAILERL